MKISRNWLKTFFEKEIPTAVELSHLFTFHFAEIESLEEIKDEKGKVIDHVFDLKVLPDRAHYALSHKGLALEVSVIADLSLKENRIPKMPDASINEKPKINIEDKNFCRRYMGRYIKNVEVSDSPICKKFLEPIGQRSINSVVDATNMNMFDIGQPMHAFDADKVKGSISVRKAKEGEKIVLLDDREVALSKDDYVIADEIGPIAIAGVKGGKRAEVDFKTKNIIIESANFEPRAVRVTSTRLNLRNDSSKRFENEITPELTSEAMNNFCALLKELSPKAEFGPVVDEYPTKAKRSVIKIDPSYISQKLGVKIDNSKIEGILSRMNISIEKKKDEWTLTIPFERLDLSIPEDIAEEVGRIWGYENIKGQIPPKTKDEIKALKEFYYAEKIKNILSETGFSEVILYTFVPEGDIEIVLPLASDKAFLRKNLYSGIFSCLERNVQNAPILGLKDIKIFEIGQVFSNKIEETMLAFGSVQTKKQKGIKNSDFIKQAISALEKGLGKKIDSKNIKEKDMFSAFEISLNEIINDLPAPDSYKDLHLARSSDNKFKPFSQYPFIVRDIAVFVPEKEKEEVVWKEIFDGLKEVKAEELLVRYELFDVFKKEGKISYAFRLVFQSMDRTLTDEEANKIMEKAYEKVTKKGWQVR